jgi:hypothetical protein
MRKQALRARSCSVLLVLTAVLLLAAVSDGIRLAPGKFLFELVAYMQQAGDGASLISVLTLRSAS